MLLLAINRLSFYLEVIVSETNGFLAKFEAETQSLKAKEEAAQFMGPADEHGIIQSLIVDAVWNPAWATAKIRHIKIDHFIRIETRYVFAKLANLYEETGVVPTRARLRSNIARELTADHDAFEEVLEVLDSKISPRDLTFIKRDLDKWCLQRDRECWVNDCIAAIEAGETPKPFPQALADSGPAPWPTDCKERQPPLIDGIIRRGEVLNIIAPPKVAKTMLVYLLALMVANGRDWLGHKCTQGRVLLIDNELSDGESQHRMRAICEATGLSPNNIDRWLLKGKQVYIDGIVERLKSTNYDLIVLDCLYRAKPLGTKENDNDWQAELFCLIDSICEETGAAWVNVHHSSKGNQADKAITDVGAGGGAMARATSSQVILRPHQEKDVYVLEGVARSFRQPEAATVKFEWPLWHVVDSDPTRILRQVGGQNVEKDRADIDRIAEMEGLITINRVRREASGDDHEIGAKRAQKLVNQAVLANRIRYHGEQEGKKGEKYETWITVQGSYSIVHPSSVQGSEGPCTTT